MPDPVADSIRIPPPDATGPGIARRHRDHHERTLAAPLSAAVRVVSGLTLLSRLAGLVRDVVTARIFLATALGSAFQAAYSLPNLFRRLFGEGALSAAFLPEYTLLKRDHPRLADQLASVTLWALTLATGAITLVLEAALLVILVVLPPDHDRSMSLQLMMLMLPMMPAVCITAILGGVLQAHGRFGPPAAAPIILNLFQVVAAGAFYLHWAGREPTAYIIGGAAVLASAVQILWSVWALRGKVHWTRVWSETRHHSRKVLRRFLPAVLGLGTLQLNTMMDVVFAMWPVWVGTVLLGREIFLDDKSNALMRYTQTLYQFPLGVFGIAVATAVFPLLSRSADDGTVFVQHLRRGLRLSLFIGFPASIGLLLVRHDLISMIYSGGRHGFEPSDVRRAGAILAGFAPAVWVYSLNHVLTRAFYAKGDTVTPMKLAIGMVGLNFSLNLTLILFFHMREDGLAWATAASAVVQCGVLAFMCPRKLGVRPMDRATTVAMARIALAGVVMGGTVGAIQWVWPVTTTWLSVTMRLAASVIGGAVVYTGVSFLLHLPELRWLLHRGAGTGAAGGEGAAAMSFD